MSRQDLLGIFQERTAVIAPSMLKCDFGNLQREVALLEAAGARLLHLDVMDGHFVPNLSYGPMVIRRLRSLTRLPLDAHLMISEPGHFLEEYLDAGCDGLTVHIECFQDRTDELLAVLEQVRSAGAAAGLALSPGTPAESVVPFQDRIDQVLVMSVEPGFGGQSFLSSSLDKLSTLRQCLPETVLLSVDGGIDLETISSAAEAGATLFVAGSAVFDVPDYREALDRLCKRACFDSAVLSSNGEAD